ncbi:MAG: RsmE family RNA methyltransferase [Candidatus Marinimicrobia bacterium]|jgi:16S rRNA (uracil1498-N3)-methyltransferase|nr:RsmE family RNA methyltransferase [Candidatus Neomarinimicrobiota bacterium]|tara:strand:- start:24 stop:734 length:711 start_codon:yes stop_codon:yes gene_type:complete
MMDETFFHVKLNSIEQNQFSLSKSESHHFIKSLRGVSGDNIWLLDGKGNAHHAQVKTIDNFIVKGRILDSFNNYGESQNNLCLALGLIKGKRMDLAIEKAVEFGVKSIQPLIFERSIRKSINIDRLNKIIVASSKQSGRSFFPSLMEPKILSDWMEVHQNETSIVCHFSGNNINEVIDEKSRSINIIVGPEGDFSTNELTLLRNYNVPFANLGPRRLRSESACISAILHINQITRA